MYKNMKLLLAGVFFLATTYKIQAADQQLKCWHCGSETVGAQDFCDIVFHEDSIPTQLIKERNISFVRHCNSTINSEHERAVCRKTVEEVDGKTVTKRFCYYTNKSDPLDHCSRQSTEKNVRRIFCEDCLTEKCNSASAMAVKLGAIVLPMFVVKVMAI